MVIARNIHTYGRAFGNGAVPTCFNDLGLSRPGIEPRSTAWEVNAPPLRQRGGKNYGTMEKNYDTILKTMEL